MIKTQGLTHIHLMVRNLERSLRFYQEVFGMRERFREGNAMVFLNTPGSQDSITLNEDASKVEVAGEGGGIAHFGFRLAAAKSRVIPFNRNGEPGATRFDFLGFEFSWGKDRACKPHLKRRTSRKKLRNSLANFTAWCKQSRMSR